MKLDPKFKIETAREYLLFFAVIFLSCVIGIIELLPEVSPVSQYRSISEVVMISLLYFGLLALLLFSMERCFSLYMYIEALWKSMGGGRGVIASLLADKPVKYPSIILTAIIFGILYAAKMSWI